MSKVTYSENNSGGFFRLSKDDYEALEKAGWNVRWRDENFLGSDAYEAEREGLSLSEAIEEWEKITGQSSNELGCSCCGTPHSFTYEGENGEYEYYTPQFPQYGERY